MEGAGPKDGICVIYEGKLEEKGRSGIEGEDFY
jgi:hypothetical protein